MSTCQCVELCVVIRRAVMIFTHNFTTQTSCIMTRTFDLILYYLSCSSTQRKTDGEIYSLRDPSPYSDRNRTISCCPKLDASSKGVIPSLLRALLAAPFSDNNWVISTYPFSDAQCSGVSPLSAGTSISASCSSNIRADSSCPQPAAMCKGVTV
jgi:hypothetical protein